VAADALDMPANVPARTRTATDSAEIFFDILTSIKFGNKPQIYVASITEFYLSTRKLNGRKSTCGGEIAVNIGSN
jgi:hypothetical protein